MQGPSVSFFFKTPLTDLTGSLCTHQHYGRCKEIEMKVMNCFEAYGRERGLKTCSDLVDDYRECSFRIKQRIECKVADPTEDLLFYQKFEDKTNLGFSISRAPIEFHQQILEARRRALYQEREQQNVYEPPPRDDAFR